MIIHIFEHTKEMFGGSIYERMLADALSARHAVRQIDVRKRLFGKGIRPQQYIMISLKQLTSKVDLWIRSSTAVAAMTKRSTKKRNIALLHHFDPSEFGNRYINSALARLFFKNIHKCDYVVTVANYWKDYLASKGLKCIEVIPNSFDVDRFTFQKEKVEEFKKIHNLLHKPIVYIGNCQTRKGVIEVYNSLKTLDVHLVSSGIQDVDLPVRNFILSYSDYILLLAASDVVITFSRFLEGWNRTAHEAMLCRTPVIGSGAGGMMELLKGGNQIICENAQDIPENLDFALANATSLGEKGYRFASQFTMQRFSESWLSLIKTLENSC